MSRSSDALIVCQYSDTSGSSVHRRTTTLSGKPSNGDSCSTTLPSVDSPSVMISSTASCPDARNDISMPCKRSVTSAICLHTGVNPLGSIFSSSSAAAKLAPPSRSWPTVTGSGCLFSNRTSIGQPAASARRNISRMLACTSSHREHCSNLLTPRGLVRNTWPSNLSILRELSTMAKHFPRSRLLRRAAS